MKKIFPIILFYAVGIVCAFTLAWRAENVNYSQNNSLASNYELNNF